MGKITKGLRNPGAAADYLRRWYHPVNLVDNLSLAITSRYPVGTHVLDREWDVLVVLDTCRVDAMETVAPEYDFIHDVGRIWSIAGSSPDWIAQTFDRKYESVLGNTAYVTANPHAETVLETRHLDAEQSPAAKRFFRYGRWSPVLPSDLGRYERVWNYEADTEKREYYRFEGNTLPRFVTDSGIAVSREHDFDRIVLHYMQPHYPYLANALVEDRELRGYEERPSASKQYGRERVFAAYLDNLRFVLDDVELLVNNVDAKRVVLTADHGEAFGEYGVYGHNPGRLHPQVRMVPWVETSASDQETYSPDVELVETDSRSTVDQLRALGYMDDRS